jgi:endo-1,4-beta-xylanase
MLLSYAARHGLRARGHTLVWHEAVPEWLAAALTSQTGEKLLTGHIHEVVGHFRRRLVHWDVVNEVIAPEDQQPRGLRTSLWYRALGPRYIDLAFQSCAATDPHALRVINEFGLEYAIPWQEKKRGAMLDLLSDLKARNIPVQALGMQAHLDAGEPALDQKVLAKFCEVVASMGLKILITEMDVRDDKLPADIRRRDAAVAAHGRAFLDAVLVNPAVLGVLTWGLSDRHSWLNDKMPRPDRLPQRPLPLDTDLRRKPLWTAMAGAFDTARSRPA